MRNMKKGILTVFVLAVVFSMIGMDCGKSYAADPILVGVPVARASTYGREAEMGIVLGAELINATGGVKVGKEMRPFKLEIADTRDQEPGVPTSEVLLAIEKLILDKKVHMLVGGPTMSECAMAALDLFPKYKILDIVNGGVWSPAWHQKTSSDIAKYKYSFKLNTHAGYLINSFVDLLNDIKKKHGLDKIYITIAEAASCKAAAAAVEKAGPASGWKVVGKEVHPIGTTDYSMMLRDVKKSGAQILFIWDFPPEAVNMIKQWHDLKIPVLPMGFIDSIHMPEIWEQTRGKCAYVIETAGGAGYLPDVDFTPLNQSYYNAFKKRFGEEPSSSGSTAGYTAMYMLKEVIERTGTLESDALVKAIEEIDMKTVSGRLRFDKASHQAIFGTDYKESLVVGMLQWLDGKRRSVWPENIAKARYKLPPWVKK